MSSAPEANELTLLREDIKRLTDIIVSMDERMKKMEQMLVMNSAPNTTPSISLINASISRAYASKSKSLRGTPCSEMFRDLDEVQALSVKELKRKDSSLADSNIVTLHFLYNYKKVAILSFTPGTTIKTVKERLSQELDTQGFYYQNISLSKKRIEDDAQSFELLSQDDEQTLEQSDCKGHQLLYCYGIHRGEQKRARTMTASTMFQPRRANSIGGNITTGLSPRGAKDMPFPPTLEMFDAKRKKKKKITENQLFPPTPKPPQRQNEKRSAPPSPLTKRRNTKPLLDADHFTHNSSNNTHPNSTLASVQPAHGDEFSDLQKLISSDLSLAMENL